MQKTLALKLDLVLCPFCHSGHTKLGKMQLAVYLMAIAVKNKNCAINDPLCQTHSPISSDHYFQAMFCSF